MATIVALLSIQGNDGHIIIRSAADTRQEHCRNRLEIKAGIEGRLFYGEPRYRFGRLFIGIPETTETNDY